MIAGAESGRGSYAATEEDSLCTDALSSALDVMPREEALPTESVTDNSYFSSGATRAREETYHRRSATAASTTTSSAATAPTTTHTPTPGDEPLAAGLHTPAASAVPGGQQTEYVSAEYFCMDAGHGHSGSRCVSPAWHRSVGECANPDWFGSNAGDMSRNPSDVNTLKRCVVDAGGGCGGALITQNCATSE